VTPAPHASHQELLLVTLNVPPAPLQTGVVISCLTPLAEAIEVGAMSVRFHVDADESGGSVSIFECDVPANARMPAPHSHDDFDETVFGLDGCHFVYRRRRAHRPEPRRALFIPRHVIHEFSNGGDGRLPFPRGHQSGSAGLRLLPGCRRRPCPRWPARRRENRRSHAPSWADSRATGLIRQTGPLRARRPEGARKGKGRQRRCRPRRPEPDALRSTAVAERMRALPLRSDDGDDHHPEERGVLEGLQVEVHVHTRYAGEECAGEQQDRRQREDFDDLVRPVLRPDNQDIERACDPIPRIARRGERSVDSCREFDEPFGLIPPTRAGRTRSGSGRRTLPCGARVPAGGGRLDGEHRSIP